MNQRRAEPNGPAGYLKQAPFGQGTSRIEVEKDMIGGLKKTTSRIAVAAAAGLFMGGIAVSPAQAADLGGDCCADLEERVAELEATTVRKGNRRVSVTLSGQVNRLLMFWDDGDESNVYETDNLNSSSRVNLMGSATIRPGWTAGFRFIWELEGTDSGAVDQIDDDAGAEADGQIEIREANWWIRSDRLGTVTLGRHQPATDNIVLLDLGGGTGGANTVNFIGGGMFIRNSAVAGSGGLITGTTISSFFPALDTARREGIMYTSPTFGGARVLVSWGEDDTWDAAIWWTKEWNSVRVAAGVGYLHNNDEEPDAQFDDGNTDNDEWKGSASIMHVPSGLFLTGAFVSRDYGGTDAGSFNQTAGVRLNRADFNWYYVSAGIRKRWNSLGQTSLYGEYTVAEDGLTNLAVGADGAGVFGGFAQATDSEAEVWGIGVNQGIDNAAMELFAAYRHFEFDLKGRAVAGGPITAVNLDDFQIFYVGGRIRF